MATGTAPTPRADDNCRSCGKLCDKTTSSISCDQCRGWTCQACLNTQVPGSLPDELYQALQRLPAFRFLCFACDAAAASLPQQLLAMERKEKRKDALANLRALKVSQTALEYKPPSRVPATRLPSTAATHTTLTTRVLTTVSAPAPTVTTSTLASSVRTNPTWDPIPPPPGSDAMESTPAAHIDDVAAAAALAEEQQREAAAAAATAAATDAAQSAVQDAQDRLATALAAEERALDAQRQAERLINSLTQQRDQLARERADFLAAANDSTRPDHASATQADSDGNDISALLRYLHIEQDRQREDQRQFMADQHAALLHQQQEQQRVLAEQQRLLADLMTRQAESAAAAEERRKAREGVHLPKPQNERFSGQTHKWPAFWRSFEARIHTNQSLSNQLKMELLVDAVKNGTAAAKIEGMATLGENYDAAVTKLQTHYGSDLALQEAVWKELYALTPIRTAMTNFEQTVDALSSKVETLRACKVQEPALNQYAFQWLLQQPSELNTELLRIRIAAGKADDPWEMKDLLAALQSLQPLYRSRQVPEKQEKHKSSPNNNNNKSAKGKGSSSEPADNVTLLQPPQPKVKKVPQSSEAKASSGNKFQTKTAKTKNESYQRAEQPQQRYYHVVCYICNEKGSHRTGSRDCSLTPNSAALLQQVIKDKRCMNCLSILHLMASCRSKFNCYHCGKRHHSHLHEELEKGKGKGQSSTSSPANLNVENQPNGPALIASESVPFKDKQDKKLENLEPALLSKPKLDETKKPLPPLNLCIRTKMLTMPAHLVSPDNASGISRTIFLDSGSEYNYIRQDLASALGLQPIGYKQTCTSSFGTDETQSRSSPWVEFTLQGPSGYRLKIGAFVVDAICADFLQKNPKLSEDDKAMVELYDVANLLPEKESNLVRVHVLLGMIDYNAIVYAYDESHVRLEGGLRILLTPFGNLLCGSKRGSKCVSKAHSAENSLSHSSTQLNAVSATTSTPITLSSLKEKEGKEDDVEGESNVKQTEHTDIVELLNKLFAAHAAGIEDEDTKSTINSRNNAIMEQFLATLRITDSGRYECGFLWKTPQPDLPNNLLRASARLNQTIRRLKQTGNQDQLLVIDNIFKEYLKKDMMEIVDDNFVIDKASINERASSKSTLLYYLSHFPVMKSTAVTTKCRVVMDGSEKVGLNKRSLNDQMHRGENLMSTLTGVLLRSRLSEILLVFDAEKAYLSCGLREQDRDSVRILWLRDPSKYTMENNLMVLRFKVVVFGLICSAFLLHATFRVLLQDAKNRQVAQRVQDHYYVDNFSLGAANLQDGISLFHDVRSMFSERGFNQRSWASNCDDFNSQLPSELRHPDLGKKDIDLLGLKWNTQTDSLHTKHHDISLPTIITKRIVAAVIAQIGYDTLGLNLATIMLGRLFMGELWRKTRDWDEPLDKDETERFQEIFCQLQLLHTVSWPRRAIPSMKDEIRLLVFTDASEKSIAATVYLWSRDCQSSAISCNLVMSKAKIVNPKPARTIVQLELNAAVMGTRLLLHVKEELSRLNIQSCHLFSDSTIVLCFLTGDKNLPKYVQRRVDEINNAQLHLHHVPGPQNPSDWPTRGVPAAQLHASLWKHGPPLVNEQEAEKWPIFQSTEEETALALAALPGNAADVAIDENPPAGIDISRFSSLRALITTTCWILRFALKEKRTSATVDEKGKIAFSFPPTAEERQAALLLWLLSEQEVCYGTELKALKAGKTTQLQLQLDLMLDEQGLIRCGGRLQNSGLALDTVHPILLGKKRHFTKLVILEAHNAVFHKKSTYTLNEIRRKYWIPQGHNLVRNTIKIQCNMCRLLSGSALAPPPMGLLPPERLQGKRAFEFGAFDHCGPINVRIKSQLTRIYVFLVCCLTTRAVHLDYTLSTSADDTVDALRRLFARRGTARVLYSDSATGFVKAAEIIRKGQQSVPGFLAGQLVKFIRNPPESPWVGGTFERLIGVCKSMLRSTFWNRVVDVEVFRTVLIEVEGKLNTRPLCVLSSELKDGSVICPSDFIAPTSMLGIKLGTEPAEDPDFTLASDRDQLSKHYKDVTRLTNNAFTYLLQHYIPSLRASHTRFFRGQRKEDEWGPRVGSVYLIQDKDKNRQQWPRCKVLQRIPGQDGKIRFCRVQLASGHVTRRGTRQLVPLEAEFEQELMNDVASEEDKKMEVEEEKESEEEDEGQVQDIAPPTPAKHTYFTRSQAKDTSSSTLLNVLRWNTAPRHSSLLFISLLLLACSPTKAFQICSNGPGGKVLTLPETESPCQVPSPQGDHVNVNITLFVPNSHYPNVPAIACYLETTEICTSVSFFGTQSAQAPTVVRTAVPVSTCRQVNATRLYEKSALVRSKRFPSMSSTNKSLEPVYRWPRTKCTPVTNLVLLEGEISTRDGKFASSSFSITSKCKILDGECVAPDITSFWGNYSFLSFCPFHTAGNFSAQRNGDLLSIPRLESSLVLSTSEPPSCLPTGTRLSKAGAAVLFLPLHPHHEQKLQRKQHLESLVSSSMAKLEEKRDFLQLKMWLNFLVEETNERIAEMMRNTHIQFCERAVRELRQIHLFIRLHPTAGMRFLLNRDDVSAHWVQDYLILHVCHQVEVEQVHENHRTPGLPPDRCWNLPPVSLRDGSVWFIAPGSRDLIPHSHLVPCHSLLTKDSFQAADHMPLPEHFLSSKINWNVSQGPLVPFTTGPVFKSTVAIPPSVQALMAERYPSINYQMEGVIAHLRSISPWSSGDVVANGLSALKDVVVDLSHNAVDLFDEVMDHATNNSMKLVRGTGSVVKEDFISPIGTIIEYSTYGLSFIAVILLTLAICYFTNGCNGIRQKIAKRRKAKSADEGEPGVSYSKEQSEVQVLSDLKIKQRNRKYKFPVIRKKKAKYHPRPEKQEEIELREIV